MKIKFNALFIIFILTGCSSVEISKNIESQNKNLTLKNNSNNNVNFKDKVVVTTFDVGTGNCQVLSCPLEKKIIINDCGSTNQSSNLNADDVSKSIIYIANNISAKTINVSTSHGDKDHVSYIPRISEYVNEYFKQKKTFDTYILGGYESGYNKETVDFIKNTSLNVVSFNEPVHSKTPYSSLGCAADNVETWILANGVGKNKNSQSLVLISVINQKSAFYFTGDMEGSTVKSIIDDYNNDKYQNLDLSKFDNVAMTLPHHGASGDGSNDPLWATFTNPNLAIASSGLKQNYGHPRCKSFDNYLNISNGYGIHPFSCFDNKKVIDKTPVSDFKFNTASSESIFTSFKDNNVWVETTK